ncbi:MAG: DNA-directed RNA polymerase subunit omega [Akkermansia sp.]
MKAELVEQASKIIPEPQMLINVVSRRVAQLNNGAPLVPTTPHMGNANIALTKSLKASSSIIRNPAASRKTTSNNTFPLLPFRTGIPYGILAIRPSPGLPARGLFILLPFVP